MNRLLILFAAGILLPLCMNAQMGAIAYLEYGYAISPYKSKELEAFKASYNSFYNPEHPFDMKTKPAKGTYMKFGIGVGDVSGLKMNMDFCIYNLESAPMEARYADGHGRDVWYEIRNSNTNVGMRFGGGDEMPFWGQVNINIGIQWVTMKSGFVHIDGSRNLTPTHSLNGTFDSFTLMGGFGVGVGCKIWGPFALTFTADRVSRGIDSRKHPEYFQYSDNNDIGTSNYMPRDVESFINGATESENSISNDLRGWRFTGGLVFMLSTEE